MKFSLIKWGWMYSVQYKIKHLAFTSLPHPPTPRQHPPTTYESCRRKEKMPAHLERGNQREPEETARNKTCSHSYRPNQPDRSPTTPPGTPPRRRRANESESLTSIRMAATRRDARAAQTGSNEQRHRPGRDKMAVTVFCFVLERSFVVKAEPCFGSIDFV